MHPCRCGLDRLFDGAVRPYRGARAGLIANPASVDAAFVHAAEKFAQCPELRLTALFGPQHGARADRQDNMIESPDDFDARLGVPVHSLYGQHRQPTAAMLENVDVLFCDLFDVGTRVYTFLWTAVLAMEACARSHRRFVVLDRPNPVGGCEVEGNVLDPAFRSFIGLYPIPMRHGLTMGELATFVNREFSIGADLDVIEVENWRREQWLDDTGLPWVMPSPNMPSLDTATVYPGTVLLEGTNLSEGRGTTRPFELVGAPFLDGDRFAARLNEAGLAGARFRPAWFRPVFDKWRDQLCGGVQIHVTHRRAFRPYRTGLAILKAAMELSPREFAWRQPPFEYEYEKLPIDILTGDSRVRLQLEQGERLEAIETSWQARLCEFAALRERYLRY